MSEASKSKLPLVIQSLVGQIALPFYLRCLQSLLKHCEENIRLLIHEDGSLGENGRERARSELGENSQFVDYGITKERTLDHLSGYPHCQAIRKSSLWGIEFFDPLFAQPDATISYYIDADILFLRPFSGLFVPEQIEGGALFLRDTQWDAYSLRPWHLFGFGMRPVIVKGITTALVCWDKREIDWHYLEWFLGKNKFHCIPEWVMPTVQAGLASKCRAKVVSPSQITNLYPNASDDKPYHTMQLFVDEAGLEVVKIVVKGREGMDTEYLIERFNVGVEIPSSNFSFDTNEYPGASIIDNRI